MTKFASSRDSSGIRVVAAVAALATIAFSSWGHPAEARANCQPEGKFSAWKSRFRPVVLRSGVSDRTVRRAYDPISYDASVIRRDRRQQIFALSFIEFSEKLVSSNRLRTGARKLNEDAALFRRAEQKFGVPGPVITAFWALESDFGVGLKNQYLIFNALATLAYDCRRPELFSEQLIAALKLVDTGKIDYDRMVGSWAGEIGETQFLPSHVLDHAVDADGDGRIDLYNSDADIIYSTANYIRHLGWRAGEPWLEEVRVREDMPWREADLAILHPRSKWAEWGVLRRDGGRLPQDDLPASLLLPMGRNGPAFLGYRNFRIYPEWNNSFIYALTAAYLATRLAGAPRYDRGNGRVEDFTYDELRRIQWLLTQQGYDTGGIDGMLGEKSRAAIKAAQIRFGLPADSYPSRALISRLR